VYRRIGFVLLAVGFGAAYALVTPPFEVPDEAAHYLRATAAAYGNVIIQQQVALPRAYRVAVWAMTSRLPTARGVTLQNDDREPVPLAGIYLPAAYVPQIATAAIGRAARVRPFFSFFAGRLAALLFAVAAVVFICRVAPRWASHFEAAALLPMSLSLFASWSADAMTIVAAFLVSALLLNAILSAAAPTRRECIAIVVAVAWLSLCKPPYALLALLVLAVPRARRRFVALVIIVAIAGTAVSAGMTMMEMETTSLPHYRPIDTRTQLRFIAAHPIHFAAVIANDLRTNGRDYIASMAGRLGRYELNLPSWMTWLLLLMLLAAGATTGPPLPPRIRLLIAAVAAMICLATLTYLYLTSSIAGGDIIEGAQGRYLLPLLPLLMTTVRIRAIRVAVPAAALFAVAAAGNVTAIMVLRGHYW
jgi:uncharacterized membrane protein